MAKLLTSVVRLTESEQPSIELTLEDCAKITKQSIEKASQLKTLMCIAIVDCTGSLIHFSKMSGAWDGSVKISMSKAYTAYAFSGDKDKQGPLSTEELYKLSQPGQPLFGIQTTNTDNGIVTFGGGVPLYKNGVLVGGLGISGSTVDNDVAVATAGAKGFN